MKRFTALVTASLVILAAEFSTVQATVYYWDRSDGVLGANPGGPNFGDGTWDTAALNWNTNPDGSGSNVAWVDGNDAVFSAGSDLQGATTPTGTGTPGPYDAEVLISGTVTATSALIEEGTILLRTGALDTGAGAVTINAGAALKIDNTVRLALTTGKVVLNGGTLMEVNTGSAGSFIGSGAGLKGLEVNGTGYIGYDDQDGVPDNKVSIFFGVITGTGGTTTNGGAGTLIKIGPDQIGIGASTQGGVSSQTLFTFAKLVVKEGSYRLRTTTFDSTVRETAFGALPTAELADAITLDGGGIGSNATVTLSALRGVTVTANGGYLDHGAGAGLNIPGPVSGSGALSIGDPTSTVTTFGTFTLSHANNVNTFSGNLIGYRGVLQLNSSLKVNALQDGSTTQQPTNNVTINVASGKTLTVGVGNGSGTWSMPIASAGAFTKTGSGTETLTGANTYTGNTTVQGGTLSITSAYLANAADVLLSTGSIFNLNTAAATDVIHSLFIDSVLQSAGVWGAVGSGAAHESALITGTGFLNASVGAGSCAAGDLNCDGHVDAGDYVFWRKTNGPAGDYTAWRANFGVPPGAGSGGGLDGGTVPEPGTIVLAVFGLVMAVATGRRR